MLVVLIGLLTLPLGGNDVGPFVRGLWLVQRFGTLEAANPDNDQAVKGLLAKAMGKDGQMTHLELGALMRPEVFKQIAGSDGIIDANDVEQALTAATPESRMKLVLKLRAHADYLTTTFDMIDSQHRAAGQQLAEWLIANYQPGKPLNVIVVCTGNSRRSIMGSSMGNLAAAYYGLDQIHFYSGGTAPSAFNPRTIEALKAIGFAIEATGDEAERGEPTTANPIYRVSWGQGFEAIEFSKHYADDSNPSAGFAALMVCSEADNGCPTVPGASLRLSMPYLDPKIYDDGGYETAKYAERRDDIGRLMLSVMAQTRRAVDAQPATH